MSLINHEGIFKPKYLTYSGIPYLELSDAQYFYDYEVPCKCGCGTRMVVPKLVYIAETARKMAGFPFPVNSWNRCWPHNYSPAVGGSKKSSHPQGYAMDIGIIHPKKRLIAVYCLIEAGAPRIKLRKNHIHFDVDPDKTWGLLLL